MAIKHKPSAKVSIMAGPTRSGNKITQKWKNPRSASSGDSAFGRIDLAILLDGKNTKGKKGKAKSNNRTYRKKTTASSTSFDFTLPRKAWYPYKGKPRLNAVSFKVRGANSRGDGPWLAGPALAFERPDAPKIEASVDVSKGEVTFTAKAKDPGGKKERHDTRLTVSRSSNCLTPRKDSLADKTSAKEELAHTCDVGESKSLTQDQWIKVSAEAWCRGLAGDSAHVSASHVFAWPAKAEITSVRSTGKDKRNGMVLVGVKTHHDADRHPVTEVRLQRLRSSALTAPEEVSTATGWADVSGATDDAQCTGLSDQLADAWPEDGKHTWYRIKSTHDDYTVYSEPAELDVYQPVDDLGAGGDEFDDVRLASATPLADGTTLAVALWWDVAGTADDGTELSYSTDPNAWRSSEGPKTFEFDWDDGAMTDAEGTAHDHSVTAFLAGLEEGVPVYIRARRYNDDEGKSYGGYTDALVATPTSPPGAVTLHAPAYVARGRDLEVGWEHASDRPQAAWALDTDAGEFVGTGATEALTIPAARLAGLDQVRVTARVCTTEGGAWSSSEEAVVAIVDAPSCSVALARTVGSHPLSLEVTTDAASPVVAVSVASAGAAVALPDGVARQAPGDVVWASDDAAAGAWEDGASGRTATVTLPASADARPELWDGCAYAVGVTVTDAATGIPSATVVASTTVEWTHQADVPGATVSTNGGGQTARIAVEAPEDFALGDVCDLYRVSLGEAALIAGGIPFGTVVTDALAPYASDWRRHALRYRVACRTADGDVAWADVPYELTCESVWLDWGEGRSLELPYDLVTDVASAKDFEARAHPLDDAPEDAGVIAEGYWGPGVRRTLSISTDLSKTVGSEALEALLACADHAGPVFVRLPNGMAVEANVVPSRVSESYAGDPVAVSVDAEEIALTDEHRPSADRGEVAAPAWAGGAIAEFRGDVYDAAGHALPEWHWVGRAADGSAGYACDPDGTVRDLTGSEMAGWAWDGEALEDGDGNTVALEGEVA